MLETLSADKIEKVAYVLKTIAHPLRLQIIELLIQNDQLSVNEICSKLGSEQSLTSHHLLNMKLKGVLASFRQGKNIYYRLKLQEVVKVIECMQNCEVPL